MSDSAAALRELPDSLYHLLVGLYLRLLHTGAKHKGAMHWFFRIGIRNGIGRMP
jgi:hypothetical protein